jgi:hypothetical protein
MCEHGDQGNEAMLFNYNKFDHWIVKMFLNPRIL